MYNLKGFITVDGLENSSPTVVSAIGELSSLSRTYAKGVGEYASVTLPYTLNSFYSQTISGETPVPNVLLTQVWAFVNWAFTLQKGNTPALTSSDFVIAMNAQFNTQAGSFGCGDLINNGIFSFPEYIAWSNPSLVTNDVTPGGLIKLWFCDNSFQQQYEEYAIVVVPPLANIDTFMSGAVSVATALANYSQSQILNAIQTARGGYPETEIVPQSYDYVDPTNSTNQILTTWSLIIYGSAGNNIDAIRQAVQDYIAANSSYSVDSWKVIFPEIYTSTEFLIIPRWYDYAFPNLNLQQGAYSSIVNLKKQLNYLSSIFSGYDQSYLEAHSVVMPTSYKSLEVLIVPGIDNAVPEQDIGIVYPDIINVPSTDTLYNMMSARTRGWLTMFLNLLIVAESANIQSRLSAGMSLAVRNNVLYVAQEYSGILYLVSTKSTTPNYS